MTLEFAIRVPAKRNISDHRTWSGNIS